MRRSRSAVWGKSRRRGRLAKLTADIDANRSSFVGRQPVFDRSLEVVGYEILLRDGPIDDIWVEEDAELGGPRIVLNTFIDISLEALTGDKPAYLNLTARSIRGGLPASLRPDHVVVLIHVGGEVPEEDVRTIQELRTHGYSVALPAGGPEPLLRAVDMAKLDIEARAGADLAQKVGRLKAGRLTLIADHVAEYQDLKRARDLGFDLFQGRFLSRPAVLRQRRVPKGHRAALELVIELQNPDARIEDLAAIIRRDISLSYRILRLVNSAYFSQPQPVESIEGAIMLLGTRQIGAWVGLIKMAEISNKPTELTTMATVRGAVCEALAGKLGRSDGQAFYTAGLFSALDALLDTSIEAAVEGLPLTSEIVNAIAGHTGSMGDVVAGVIAYETADWENAEIAGVDEATIAAAFRKAIVETDSMWARIGEAPKSGGVLS